MSEHPTKDGLSARFPIGSKIRYWRDGGGYIPVEVVGYTKSGRIRVRHPPNEAGYVHVGAVKSTSVSYL